MRAPTTLGLAALLLLALGGLYLSHVSLAADPAHHAPGKNENPEPDGDDDHDPDRGPHDVRLDCLICQTVDGGLHEERHDRIKDSCHEQPDYRECQHPTVPVEVRAEVFQVTQVLER